VEFLRFVSSNTFIEVAVRTCGIARVGLYLRDNLRKINELRCVNENVTLFTLTHATLISHFLFLRSHPNISLHHLFLLSLFPHRAARRPLKQSTQELVAQAEQQRAELELKLQQERLERERLEKEQKAARAEAERKAQIEREKELARLELEKAVYPSSFLISPSLPPSLLSPPSPSPSPPSPFSPSPPCI
jgi:hypothetical protein